MRFDYPMRSWTSDPLRRWARFFGKLAMPQLYGDLLTAAGWIDMVQCRDATESGWVDSYCDYHCIGAPAHD